MSKHRLLVAFTLLRQPAVPPHPTTLRSVEGWGLPRFVEGELLVVSQFTLYGDCRKGRRPSFDKSASPEIAENLYNRFVEKLRNSGLRVETGVFGAMMQVSIANDGPVTLLLER